MTLTIDMPADMESRLRKDVPNLDAKATEALALELFRNETIGIHEFGRMLGMDRFEAERFLNERKEYAQTLTVEEVWKDVETIKAVLRDMGR